jgi:hypothetical protein
LWRSGPVPHLFSRPHWILGDPPALRTSRLVMRPEVTPSARLLSAVAPARRKSVGTLLHRQLSALRPAQEIRPYVARPPCYPRTGPAQDLRPLVAPWIRKPHQRRIESPSQVLIRSEAEAASTRIGRDSKHNVKALAPATGSASLIHGKTFSLRFKLQHGAW